MRNDTIRAKKHLTIHGVKNPVILDVKHIDDFVHIVGGDRVKHRALRVAMKVAAFILFLPLLFTGVLFFKAGRDLESNLYQGIHNRKEVSLAETAFDGIPTDSQ